ncbi:hypothetical protein KEC58_13030 [Photobacterium damselae]|uniref:hypothetical protein n=1 Tax=Photobacterium damselae TaxID=38293 RepID=UPI002542C3E3
MKIDIRLIGDEQYFFEVNERYKWMNVSLCEEYPTGSKLLVKFGCDEVGYVELGAGDSVALTEYAGRRVSLELVDTDSYSLNMFVAVLTAVEVKLQSPTKSTRVDGGGMDVIESIREIERPVSVLGIARAVNVEQIIEPVEIAGIERPVTVVSRAKKYESICKEFSGISVWSVPRGRVVTSFCIFASKTNTADVVVLDAVKLSPGERWQVDSKSGISQLKFSGSVADKVAIFVTMEVL